MIRTLQALVVLAIAHCALPAMAQDAWPARPVRFVVPSSPGGGTDVYARLLAQGLSEALKQPFIVENKPGASGNIGADLVAKAAPDGYTFLISANPSLSINPSLYKNLPYNAERDFTPVSRGVMAVMVIIAHPSAGAKTLAELVALGKRAPGKLAYGSAGSGSPPYLGNRLIEETSGARFTHIPYKGVGNAYQDLLGGQIKFLFPDLASALPHIRSGKVVALAVTPKSSQVPAVPTPAEAGFPLDVFTSFSVVAPAGTPPAIVQRLSVEIGKVSRSAGTAEKLEAQGLIPIIDTPEQFAASLKKEREGWAAFIRRNDIKLEE